MTDDRARAAQAIAAIDAFISQMVSEVRSSAPPPGSLLAALLVSPATGEPLTDAELRATLEAAHRLMRGRLDGAPGSAQAYRRKGRPCPRCRTAIKSWPQGDDARMAYWCPECQRGEEPKTA